MRSSTLTLAEPQEVRQQVLDRVRCRVPGRIRDLEVQIQEEGVILKGQTDSYYSKQLAQHAAMEVLGQGTLTNDIQVR